jgi:hypothetical protein
LKPIYLHRDEGMTPMSLSDIFNDNLYRARKENDTILRVTSGNPENQYMFSATHYYDFGLREIVIAKGHGISVTPFSQVDREVLETMHAKLTDLGGHPPPLPPSEIVVVERKPKGLGL